MGELRCATVCLPFVLSAARHCVRSHARHVTERPRLGFPFARSAAAEVNYSCVQIGHAILRRHPITGAVQRGNSVTHSVADATLRIIVGSLTPKPGIREQNLLRVQLITATLLVVYRQGFRSPRSSAGVD